MRVRLVAAIVAVSLMLGAASPRAVPAGGAGAEQTVGNHDNTRVRVQLAVLGMAAFLVVGVGTAAYVARKKLGLDTAPPPDDASSRH